MAEGPVWLDAQPLLRRLSSALQPGELVHSEHFSLFDAMSAIEIGNAKMDPGAVQPQTSRSLDEVAPLKLSNVLTLKLMDQLMAQEASWYRGNMLEQTVFTCLYILYPERCVAVDLKDCRRIAIELHAVSLQYSLCNCLTIMA